MDASPLRHNIGMVLVSISLKPEFACDTGTGLFHGRPIAALIDTEGCFMMIMVLGYGVPAINFRTEYLRPAINTSLHVTASLRRVGRTVGIVDVDVNNDEGKLVAVGRGTLGSNAG